MVLSNKSGKSANAQLHRLKAKIKTLESQVTEMKSNEQKLMETMTQEINETKRIEEQLLQKNKNLSRLFTISLHLLESLERKTLLQKIADHAANLVGTDTSAIYMAEGDDLIMEVTSPELPNDFPMEFRMAKLINHPHIKMAIDTGTSIIVQDASKVQWTMTEQLIVDNRNLVSLAYIPLFIQKKVKGVIILGAMEQVRFYEQNDIDLFTIFSNITSLALENSYLFENLLNTKIKAEESNRLKTAFLHNISHEIRTPLNAIIGFSDLISKNDLTQDVRSEYAEIIMQSNNQLLSIIDDILSISHIETRQVALNATSVNLNGLMKRFQTQYQIPVVKKGLEFRLNNPFAGQDVEIITDENKLSGIISNLLNNAVKYTDEGTIELGAAIKDDAVEFYVQDTGIGMAEDEQKKIFDRFYQIDNVASRMYGGMGLGLSICAAYVEILNGTIQIKSALGEGSRFTVSIPAKMTGNTNKEQSIKDTIPEKINKEKTILVAEDDDTNYAFIREVLNSLGYKTIRAVNGLDAIETCTVNPHIDLILMDIRMPVKNGFESAGEILKIRPHLPIVAQTAYGYPDDRNQAIQKGCIDLITKPFSIQQLATVVEKYIR